MSNPSFNRTGTEPKRRGEMPVVFTLRPRCPVCGAAELKATASRRQGDGSTLRYCRCRACGQNVKLVVE